MKYLLLFVFIISAFSTQAQYDTSYIAVMPFISVTEQGKEFVKAAELNAINVINNNYQIQRVDRDVSNAVQWEREFQKSEDFIDGKIVEQGKAIGADYVMEGFYDHSSKELTMSIYEVSSGAMVHSVVAEQNIVKKKKKKKGLLGVLLEDRTYVPYDRTTSASYKGEKGYFPSPKLVRSSAEALLKKCFPEKLWTVVRATEESKSKSKLLLIAAGSRMGIARRTFLEIQIPKTEEVDGVELKRMESIGWGRVVLVEGEHFSIMKVDEGGKKIKQALDAGVKLKCRIQE